MIDWIPTNPQFVSFVEDHFLFLGCVYGILYGILRAMFPDSKLLRAVGEWVGKVTKRKEKA